MLYDKDKLSDIDPGEDAPLVRRRHHMQRLAEFSLSSYLTDTAYQRVGTENTPPALQQVELRHVGIYVMCLATIATSMVMCAVSIFVPYVLPAEGKAALRNLIVCALVGAALLYKPVLVHTGGVVQQTVPPLRHLHKTLRNCVVCILAAWATEALQDSSCVAHEHEIGVLRHAFIVLAFCAMFAAACCRAAWPQGAGDAHVCVSLASLVALCCLPQTQFWAANPLARQLGAADAAIRACRVLLFSTTFCGVVIACTPVRVFLVDPLVLTVRAFAASAWVLACPPALLFMVPPFCTVLCLRRVHARDADAAAAVEADADAEAAVAVATAPGATPVVEGRPSTGATQGAAVSGSYVSRSALSDDRKKFLLAKLSGNA